jgi:hypothetical protein
MGESVCALLDKPTVAQLLKSFQVFYETRRIITAFTREPATGTYPGPDQSSSQHPIIFITVVGGAEKGTQYLEA